MRVYEWISLYPLNYSLLKKLTQQKDVIEHYVHDSIPIRLLLVGT